MHIKDLTEDQKTQLKQTLYIEKNENVSYYELAHVNDFITDDELEQTYGHICFVEDDFI